MHARLLKTQLDNLIDACAQVNSIVEAWAEFRAAAITTRGAAPRYHPARVNLLGFT
jgi:tRNA A37 threonylcarbamoyladenosine dehydratase